MGFYDFKKDLEKSFKDFNILREFLTLKGATEIVENHDKKHDLSFSINGKTYTMEIKQDFMFEKTGNVAIEFKSRGKLSGVSSSTANFWCYILKDKLYISPLVNVREKLNKYLFSKEIRVVSGGDNRSSQLLLIPLDKFYKIFKEVK